MTFELNVDAQLLWQKIQELEAEIEKLKNPEKETEAQITSLNARNQEIMKLVLGQDVTEERNTLVREYTENVGKIIKLRRR